MKTQDPIVETVVNGLDTGGLRGLISGASSDAANAKTHWQVTSHWRGGARSDAHVTECQVGKARVKRDYLIRVDEPLELGGTNQYANPQEYLLASLNACMIVGYTALCALEGITLEELRIETEGHIDLRGFLGLDPSVRPGYDQLRYTVHLKGSGTPEQFERIHRAVMGTSPNYDNLANVIPMNSRLVIGESDAVKPRVAIDQAA